MPGRDHGRRAVSWWGDTAPATGPTGTTAIWLGVQLSFHVDGWIQGFRLYVPGGNDGGTFGVLYDPFGQHMLCAFRFRERADAGANAWHQTWVKPQVRVDINATWRLAILLTNGGRFQTNNMLNGSPNNHNDVEFFNGFTTTALSIVGSNPTLTTFAPGVDVLFHPDQV